MNSQGIGVVGREEGFFRRWRAAMLSDSSQIKNTFFWKFLFFLPSMAILALPPHNSVRFRTHEFTITLFYTVPWASENIAEAETFVSYNYYFLKIPISKLFARIYFRASPYFAHLDSLREFAQRENLFRIQKVSYNSRFWKRVLSTLEGNLYYKPVPYKKRVRHRTTFAPCQNRSLVFSKLLESTKTATKTFKQAACYCSGT